jgi:hypothetical protein
MDNWQDWLVTAVAGVAGLLVLQRTLGAWKDSKPGSASSPACDGCALADAVHRPEHIAGSKDPAS